MKWVIENLDSLLTIGMSISLVVIWVMNKAGWINKQAAQEIATGIEESHASITAALKDVDPKKIYGKDGKIDIDAVALVAQKAVKGTVKQRMGRALKSVAGVVTDVAANVDPDPAKLPRTPVQRLRGLIRSRFLGG